MLALWLTYIPMGALERIAMSEKITLENGRLSVPNHPVIPFIEGDGIGQDIWKNARAVLMRQ